MKYSNPRARRFLIVSVLAFASLAAILFAFERFASSAAFVTRTWDGGGVTNNWSEAANWSGDTLPTAGDAVVFDGTSVKNAVVDSTTTVSTLSINSGYSGAISILNNLALTATGGATLNDGTINVGTGSLNLGGNSSLTMNGGALNLESGSITAFFLFTVNGGTFNGGSGSFPSNSAFGPVITVNGGNFVAPQSMTVRGFNLAPSAGFNHNNGTITCIGSNSTFISSSARVVNNLELTLSDGAGITTNANTTVSGTLTLTEGLINSGTLRSLGPVSIGPSFGSAGQGGGGGNLFLDDDGVATPRPVDFPAGVRLPNLRINDADFAISSNGVGSVDVDDLQLDAGSIDMGANELIVGYSPATAGSPFVQNGGAITFSSGNFTTNTAAVFTLNAGTFSMGSGTALINPGGFGGITINGGTFNAPNSPMRIGSIGGVSSGFSQSGGVFNGNGDLDVNGGFTLSGGTFNAPTGTSRFGFTFTHTPSGTFNHNGGTARFDSPHPGFSMNVTTNGGVETFNNLVLEPSTDNAQIAFSSRTFRANGDLEIVNGRMNAVTFEVAGNVIVGPGADGDNGQLVFIGTNSQSFANNGGLNTTGTWTINKPSGAVTAATDMLLATTQTLNVTSGSLYLADGSDLSVGPVTVSAAGRLVNETSTTITLGGNLVNSGLVVLRGGGADCPQADTIFLRSSVNGILRNWSGSGTFAISDADIRDMSGTAPMVAYNSTNGGNNGPNWSFDPGCPPGLSISPQVVSLYRTQTATFTAGGGFGIKTFSISVNNSGANINPTSGFYSPGNTINVTDTVRATDQFGQFADAQVSVIPGPATRLQMNTQPPTTVQAGIAISPISVLLRDDQGNTIPNAANPVTVSILSNPGGSTLSGTLTRNAVNGIVTFDDVSLNRPGANYSLGFTSPGLVPATSAAFTVVPGPPAQLAFVVQPTDTEPQTGIAPPVTVHIQDSVGNLVPIASASVTVTIADNPSGGILQGLTNVGTVGGIATFNNISITQVGNGYTLSASATGLTGATSMPFNILSPFVVRNTNDGGPGSLRNAITKANQTPGAQTITFNVPGPGPYSISPQSPLPVISESVTIDGKTQPGYAGFPIIELHGSGTGTGIEINTQPGPGSIVDSLAINGWITGIYLGNSIIGNANKVIGCFIGTNVAGNVSVPNQTGIRVNHYNDIIGGTVTTERNVISGNTGFGVWIAQSLGAVVKGNLIGVAADGITPLGNGADGIRISGGPGAPALNHQIGGIAPGEGNIIANNGYSGVGIESNYVRSSSIRGNSIFNNVELGISTNGQTPRPNDPTDSDISGTGGNGAQNYPALDYALSSGSGTTVRGTLNSAASSGFTLDFYSSPACDQSGYGEGKTYLGSATVATNTSNQASFTVLIPTQSTPGQFVTATATDSRGNTSEFSRCRLVSTFTASISGRITSPSGTPERNVQVRLTGAITGSTLTNSNGDYSFANLPNAADYTVTPTKQNFELSPASRSFSNLPGNQTAQNFTATKTSSSIKGNLYGNSGASIWPLSGVLVNLSGTESRTITASGSYTFSGLAPGQYTVTVNKNGWTFNQPSTDVSLTLADTTLLHTATPGNAPDGRIFHSSIYPRVISADGTGDMDLNFIRIRPGIDASPDGTKLTFVGLGAFQTNGTDSLYLADSDGGNRIKVVNATLAATSFKDPRFSPDGSKIAYAYNSGGTGSLSSIRILDLSTESSITVPTGSLAQVSMPGWISASRLAFYASDGNDYEIYAVNTDGSGLAQLTDNSGADKFPSVSYDGSKIAYASNDLGSNTLAVMNSDGSNKVFLRNDARPGRNAWSPDGSMIAIEQIIQSSVQGILAINSTNGSQISEITSQAFTTHPALDWAPDIGIPTPAGTNVPVESGGVAIHFAGVTGAGETNVTPIPPGSAGTAPNGFVVGNIAYEISTTAAYTAPVTVCFTLSSTSTLSAFNALSLMHNEGGVLVDRTTSRDFSTRTICGNVTTLSPFVVAEHVDPALPSISGYVADSIGAPMADVAVELTGAESRFAKTDGNGYFTFANLIDGESYTVQPKRPGYIFSEYSEDFYAITGEKSAVFIGTTATFGISGRVTDGTIGIAGVTVSLEGTILDSAVTDANGDYSFNDLPGDGIYVVSPPPDLAGFAPVEYQIDSLLNDATGLDFMKLSPTAAGVSIMGRVSTSDGNGISGARLTLTSSQGTQRISISSPFGYFKFENVEVGQTYVLEATSKQYIFANPTRVFSLQDEITDMDFIADPE